MKKIKFLKESLNHFKTVGTLTRSSRFVCKKMADQVDYKNAKFLVELGAGDGVITNFILERMSPDARLMTFEVNPTFCETLRAIDDDRLIVIEDTAEKLPEYMEKHDFPILDTVISAIPFIVVPDEIRYLIIELCRDNMRDNAPYVQIHYSPTMKKLYKSIFGNVDVNFVPLNVPPAFVLVSRRDPTHLTTE